MASTTDSKNSSDLRVENIEKSETPALDAHYDPAFVKRTIRRVDWRMLPLLGFLYAVALIDRTNLGIARSAGMAVDLRLTIGERYSIASMIYFVPYILLEIPSNLVLRFMGARLWLTICVVGWGAAQLGMGFVPTWGYLVLCRVFLGVFEAGFFPALVFIITTWYKRHEVQKRLAIFYLSAMVITAFSSIFAYVLTLLKGRGGLNGWQWIFIIEGVITIALGLLTWLYIPDFPDKSKFLNEAERKMILDRVEADRGDSIPDKMTRAKFFKHFFDPLVWAFAYMFLASTVPAYAIGFFITIILGGMGYSTTEALLLTAPPGLVGAISVYFFAHLSDRTRLRAPWLAAQNLLTITGLFVAAYAKLNAARYVGLFLVNMGASGCVPGVLAYSANNITSHTKRAIQTAVIIAAGGIGGILATTMYREKDYPRYIPGMWATIGFQFGMLAMLAITTFVFHRRNTLRRAGKIGPLEGQEDFYYTL
ncbi:putative transporter C11D3.18C [Psilocybe cubensis]|uniref:Transporter C11D3.18C n=2 Tax=Psilocybe cubensis TaxID=181762 RepID=A0ACB8HIZ0_PSICU|nr:putative transporter C11D3.18C [Psilocybe cubensis]KAH9487295.1 putative transporter C11D3.18C [Psilocybe cubensis]